LCVLKPGVEDDRAATVKRDGTADHARFPSFDDYPGLRKWNLWGYIDGSAVPVINAVVGGSLGRMLV
jgi:hypothetical protein